MPTRIDAMARTSDRFIIRDHSGPLRRIAWVADGENGQKDLHVTLQRAQRMGVVNPFDDAGPQVLHLLAVAGEGCVRGLEPGASIESLRRLANIELDKLVDSALAASPDLKASLRRVADRQHGPAHAAEPQMALGLR